jgi:phage gp36-like protein
MAYTTAQEIADRYGLDYLQIVSDRNCDNLADVASVALAIKDADAEINKFLSSKYVVPITDVDANDAWSWIKRCSADLAIYFLAETAATMTTLIKERRDHCMEQLKMIAAGTITPGGPAVALKNSTQVCANARLMTRSQLCEII